MHHKSFVFAKVNNNSQLLFQVSLNSGHAGGKSPIYNHTTAHSFEAGLALQKSYLWLSQVQELSVSLSCTQLAVYLLMYMCGPATITIPFHFMFHKFVYATEFKLYGVYMY